MKAYVILSAAIAAICVAMAISIALTRAVIYIHDQHISEITFL